MPRFCDCPAILTNCNLKLISRLVPIVRPSVPFDPSLPALSRGPAEGDVLRVGGEGLDAREELLGGGDVVEAESDAAEVVGGDVHDVEELVLRGVLGQVVDHVLPQGEARPLLHQEDLKLQF